MTNDELGGVVVVGVRDRCSQGHRNVLKRTEELSYFTINPYFSLTQTANSALYYSLAWK